MRATGNNSGESPWINPIQKYCLFGDLLSGMSVTSLARWLNFQFIPSLISINPFGSRALRSITKVGLKTGAPKIYIYIGSYFWIQIVLRLRWSFFIGSNFNDKSILFSEIVIYSCVFNENVCCFVALTYALTIVTDVSLKKKKNFLSILSFNLRRYF